MRMSKAVVGTYRVTARSTAQAIKIAEEYRRMGWRCSSRGKRIVLTTYEEAFLSPITAVLIWQVDRSPHDEACRQWLVPELRGGRPREEESAGRADASASLEGEEGHAGDEEVEDNHGERR